ncbi:MAG: ribonuclease E/G [Lachnospiraceae bacterium]|nr:ribonuclease E/G [Lachnospiraceae bacterium]
MDNRLIITRKQDCVKTYYFENDKLVTIHAEQTGNSILNNIYIGKVKNIVKNINAAFIEIQKEEKCYISLKELENPLICNTGHTAGSIVEGDEIVVQVVKDAMKTKDPSVSTNLSLSGTYIVVSYPNKKIGFSNKLSSYAKKELKKYMLPYIDSEFGYIVRTNAADLISENESEITDAKAALLEEKRRIFLQEIAELTVRLKEIIQISKTRKPFTRLYEAEPKYIQSLKNIKSNTLNKIVTDDSEIYYKMEQFLAEQQPDTLPKLSLYTDEMLSLTKLYRLETLLKEALDTKVWLKSGGYLIIEPTEALTVIDVNSGKNVSKKSDKETFFYTNQEAALEIARQLRLRNLSGIIVIDFINMTKQKEIDTIMKVLRDAVKKDSVKTNIIDMTALGLVEITRKKIEPSLKEQLTLQQGN